MRIHNCLLTIYFDKKSHLKIVPSRYKAENGGYHGNTLMEIGWAKEMLFLVDGKFECKGSTV